MNPRRKQEIFDIVAKHLMSQGRKSLGDTGCAYHSDDGSSCAVGCLIPEEVVTSTIEGLDIDQAFGRAPELFRRQGIAKEHLHLLSDLQNVHDDYPVPEWAWKLVDVAEQHGLEPSAELRAYAVRAC